MENLRQKKDERTVRNIGILSFAPLVLFIGWLVYYGVVLGEFIAGKRLENHMAMAGETAANYTSLFLTLAIVSILAFGVMLYMIWHVWTKTNLPAGQKVVWVVFLFTFFFLAFPVYWYMHFKNDRPRNNPSPALS